MQGAVAVIRGKQRMLERYKDSDKNRREILTLPGMPQFRTIRHLCGTGAFSTSVPTDKVPDPIGIVGDFRYVGKRYAIPRSALRHPAYDNLFATGGSSTWRMRTVEKLHG